MYVGALRAAFGLNAQPTAVQPECARGKYWTDGSCADAPVGHYTPQSGSTSPIPCPAGTHQPQTGRYQCIACPVGEAQPATGSVTRDAENVDTYRPNFYIGIWPKFGVLRSLRSDPVLRKHFFTERSIHMGRSKHLFIG